MRNQMPKISVVMSVFNETAYVEASIQSILGQTFADFEFIILDDASTDDTPEIIARGITVDVIGVAMNQRHTLATQVHSYRAANDPNSLRRAIADVFAEVGSRTTDTASDEAFAVLKSIPDGVALAAIQGLLEQIEVRDLRIEELEERLEVLESRLPPAAGAP